MDLEIPGFHYNRINNPTVDVLEQRLAALERGVAAMAVSSGTAAVSMSVLNLLSAGDNFVSVPTLYGATYTYFAHVLPRLGIETRFMITHPASTTHRQLTSRDLGLAGITPDIVRLSIGLEHPDDLIEDLDEALDTSS
jgi:O-acetylhomoserine (thiol)-lyase